MCAAVSECPRRSCLPSQRSGAGIPSIGTAPSRCAKPPKRRMLGTGSPRASERAGDSRGRPPRRTTTGRIQPAWLDNQRQRRDESQSCPSTTLWTNESEMDTPFGDKHIGNGPPILVLAECLKGVPSHRRDQRRRSWPPGHKLGLSRSSRCNWGGYVQGVGCVGLPGYRRRGRQSQDLNSRQCPA